MLGQFFSPPGPARPLLGTGSESRREKASGYREVAEVDRAPGGGRLCMLPRLSAFPRGEKRLQGGLGNADRPAAALAAQPVMGQALAAPRINEGLGHADLFSH